MADERLLDETLSRQLGARSESRLLLAAPFRHSSLVFAIRCTQTLLKRLAAHPNDTDQSETTTVLGDWYVNTLNVGRLRLLLCSSERSLLTAIIPAAPLRTFPDRLEQAIARILTGLPITASAIARERREMTWHRFDRTRSRHVLGSMNDFAFLAEGYIRDDGPDLDLERIAGMLNGAPCRPIQYQSPDRLTPALFARAG